MAKGRENVAFMPLVTLGIFVGAAPVVARNFVVK
jgi:hypothetical protein